MQVRLPYCFCLFALLVFAFAGCLEPDHEDENAISTYDIDKYWFSFQVGNQQVTIPIIKATLGEPGFGHASGITLSAAGLDSETGNRFDLTFWVENYDSDGNLDFSIQCGGNSVVDSDYVSLIVDDRFMFNGNWMDSTWFSQLSFDFSYFERCDFLSGEFHFTFDFPPAINHKLTGKFSGVLYDRNTAESVEIKNGNYKFYIEELDDSETEA